MLERTLALSLFLAVTTTVGCASHAAMRGSVVMKIDATQAHVCLGKNEVAVSDTVQLYRHACQTYPKGGTVCHREAAAQGKVTQLLDDHYSVVTFPVGSAFAEGDTIEKLQ